MDIDKIKQNNPQLYWDMVANNIIPYSTAGALQWGSPVTNLFAESLLNGPNQPDYTSIPLPTDFSSPTVFAESGSYPKPWRSAAQKLQNANYTNVGPYAAMIGWLDVDAGESICDIKNKENNIQPARLYGRWGVATSGPNAGQGAFFPQDWYNPSEGTYNANFWNTYFSDQGNPLDPPWQLRKEWWESINKTTILSRFGNTGLVCQIEVAQSFFEFGTPEYFAGIDLAVYPDYSLDLLVAMVAIAAAVRWL